MSKQTDQNIFQVGIKKNPLKDLYHFLLNTSWPKLIGLITICYVISNALFAWIYLLAGDIIENAHPHSFSDAFFFSVQTMATIGYGKMLPKTLFANILVSFEALIGLLGVTMATGLMFAKFSKPTARVIFSKVAVVTLHNGIPCLMFRMGNERGNQIAEATLRVTLARTETTLEGEKFRKFYDLELMRSRNAIFQLTWTAIHPIDETSPFFAETAESLKKAEGQIIVSFTGLDETFSQSIHARHSYNPEEIHWNKRLANIITTLPNGQRMIDYHSFHETTS